MNLIQPVKERNPLALVALTMLITLLMVTFLLWRLVQYSDLSESTGSVLLFLPLLVLSWFYVLHAIRVWSGHLVEMRDQQGAELAAGVEDLRQDVDERQRAEAAVARYFDLSLDLLCIAGFDGYFKRLNPAWEKLLGWSNEELCAQPFISFVHPEDQATTLAAAQHLAGGNQIVGFENRYRCKDGTWRWLLWQSASSPEEGLIYAVAHDFTKRHEMEAGKDRMIEHALEFDETLLQLRGQPTEQLDIFLPLTTEKCALSLAVERVSVWLLDETGQELACRDLYQRSLQAHSRSTRLLVAHYPHYFEALASRVVLAADDALHDPASQEFAEGYLIPLGIGALLDVPLMSGGKLVGVLCCEHVGPSRQWTVQEQKFAAAVATRVMLAIETVQRHQAFELLLQRQEMLAAIRILHEQFLLASEDAIQRAYESLLALLLRSTQSEYGFAGEVRHTAEGQPYVKTFALSNIAWDADSRRLDEEQASQGLELRNLHTLFGAVLTSQQAVIANSPATDPRPGGLPAGHPPLQAFLGIPIRHGTELLGMVGLANRPGGYAESTIAELEPLLATAGSLILADRSERQRRATAAALRQLNDTLEQRVTERTAQLNAASANLQRQANQLRLFRNLLDRASDGIYVIDPASGRFLDLNETACYDLGYTREELLQRSVLDIQTNIPDLPTWQAHVQELRTQDDALIEFEALRKDGRRFPVEVKPRHVSIEDQAYIITVVRDITERKQAEQSLIAANRALRILSVCNSVLIHAQAEKELLLAICRSIVELGGYLLAWVEYPGTPGGEAPLLGAWYGDEAAHRCHVELATRPEHASHCLAAIALRMRQPQMCNDLQQMPEGSFAPLSEVGVAAILALPLLHLNDIYGVLTIFSSSSDAFGATEIELAQELGNDLAYGIVTLRTQQERNHYQQENLKSVSQLKDALTDTIRAVALMVEKRDPFTAGHQNRVADLAVAIAGELGLDAGRIQGLKLGAMIHDIGKIYVPAEILSRSGQLSAPEFEMIKSHPAVGYDIMKDVKFPWPVAEMILQHHERMDGSGYPRGLKGEEILLEARILAVADVVEAITSHRPYRPALGLDQAIAQIETKRGQLYDASVVDACLRLFRERGYSLAPTKDKS